jgi:hypothetical protein
MPAPSGSLLPQVRADYDLREPIDQIEVFAGPIRRALPGRWGRQVARRHLRDELEMLVPMQVGRTRARLQQALQVASPQLVAAMEIRYTEALSGLVAALDAATDLAGATAAQTAAARAGLDARIATLHTLTGRLATASAEPAIVAEQCEGARNALAVGPVMARSPGSGRDTAGGS